MNSDLWDWHDTGLLAQIIGKTVSSASYFENYSNDVVLLGFTDGSCLKMTSWDSSGYISGIYVTSGEDEQ